jgi:predicted PurR-regulated permease PerM
MDPALYRRIVLFALTAALAWALYLILAPFWNALAWGACLAFLLAPLQARLTRALRGRAGAAAGLITALTPVVLLAPLTLLVLSFADQATVLIRILREQAVLWRGDPFAQLERWPMLGRMVGWARDNVPVSSQQMQEWLTNGVENLLRAAASMSGGLLAGAVGTLVGFFMMLFLLFFLLRDGRSMLERLKSLVPLEGTRRDALLELVANTTWAVVFGTVATAVLQGALVGIGFAIAGLPSPVVFGVLAAMLALLPVGGAAVVWVPAALWLAATQQWAWAIFMTIWGAGVSSSDNFLRPMLISAQAPVSTLAVFIGVIGGVSAFGAVGLIIGPVLLALIGAVVRFVDAEYNPKPAASPADDARGPDVPPGN